MTQVPRVVERTPRGAGFAMVFLWFSRIFVACFSFLNWVPSDFFGLLDVFLFCLLK